MNNKKELEQHLLEVKWEMEENAKLLDFFAEMLHKSVKYAMYLHSNDIKNLNKDSLEYYRISENNYGFGYDYFISPSAVFKTYAFENFKLSGSMRQIKNKELLFSIWDSYAKLDLLKNILDRGFQIKESEAIKEIELLVDGKPVAVPMQVFHRSPLPFQMKERCEEFSGLIKKTLLMFEESKRTDK